MNDSKPNTKHKFLTLDPIEVIAHYTGDGFPKMRPLTGQQ